LARPVSSIAPESVQDFFVSLGCRALRRQLEGAVTQDFLALLLSAMELALFLSPRYRRNLDGFQGTYVFMTEKELVGVSAVFKEGKLKISESVAPSADVTITFRDAKSLWAFLLSKDQDILDCILKNTVEVEGNLNYVYRLGFLATDLEHRLGVG